MDRFIGVKIVEAEFKSMSPNEGFIGEHSEEREGYKVVYEDGYVSWSPKDVFEKAYKKICPGLNFADIEINAKTGDWKFSPTDKCADS